MTAALVAAAALAVAVTVYTFLRRRPNDPAGDE